MKPKDYKETIPNSKIQDLFLKLEGFQYGTFLNFNMGN